MEVKGHLTMSPPLHCTRREIDRTAVRRPDERASLLRSRCTNGARAIFNHKRLAEPLGQPLPNEARQHVERAASRKANDNMHRPHRIIERSGAPRQNRQRRCADGQMQKSPAIEFTTAPQLRCASAHRARRSVVGRNLLPAAGTSAVAKKADFGTSPTEQPGDIIITLSGEA
jgi:hypothetical protein